MEKIRERIKALLTGDIVIAFSGGVDSSLLLKLTCEEGEKLGKKVYAVTFETKLHPACDLDNAKKIAEEVGAIHHVIQVDELENIDIKYNPEDRCYRCKYYLFQTLKAYAEKVSAVNILDGTNYDDLSAYRPGIQALKELGIISPLVELEITKREVRQYAKDLGLSVSNRPSAPCLATRLPYGAEIDFDLLEQIDQGEDYLKTIGFAVNRIRVHGDIARIEIEKKQFTVFKEQSEEIVEQLKKLGFVYITLDMEGFRSGSMDIHINKEK